ncbi:MAG TPA: class I adenylate-forming enzyme family protein [Longimicrobiales bacterium]|nr:class I adenylate-forming enzyme family protein [Longimicrobiales bacterium]
MNCTALVSHHFRTQGSRTALWEAGGETVTFSEVARLAGGAQGLVRAEGLGAGDAALVLGLPGPTLFASVLGLLGLGVTVVFVEPWLPVDEIDHVIRRVQPRAFLGSRPARLWALRVPAVRDVPRWIPLSQVRTAGSGRDPICCDVDPGTPGTLTFSSGTTGRPKGLVRSHGCLETLFRLLGSEEASEIRNGPDLCVFPNLALLHLATGRGAVLVPSGWRPRALARAARVARRANPTTLSCGPGFLERLLARAEARPGEFGSLRQIAVGGAQVDCGLLERGFARWGDARWLQVYGGSEAEPVCITDARASVAFSRERGLFQALHLGRPIGEIETDLRGDGLWVRGPNVASVFGAEADDAPRPGDDGWHRMGDRIAIDRAGWWYWGRASQPRREFELEQRVYAELGTSACFLHRHREGSLVLYGERLPRRAFSAEFRAGYPALRQVRSIRIVRDRRHRARIDRTASLANAGIAA